MKTRTDLPLSTENILSGRLYHIALKNKWFHEKKDRKKTMQNKNSTIYTYGTVTRSPQTPMHSTLLLTRKENGAEHILVFACSHIHSMKVMGLTYIWG